MEKRGKALVALSITCFALSVSIYLFRKQKKPKPRLCYLARESSKPQAKFKRVLADNSYSKFKHLKPDGHPYRDQIEKLLSEPDVALLEFATGRPEWGPETAHWVDSEAQLKSLAGVLAQQRAFGVDTEQHALRSFLGFTALIQISTTEQVYLLDSIALHDQIEILRPAFADPAITKVFHGADNDVLWLQRDFHIYVVNLFDTAKACEILSKPQRSLAYLLESYCGVSKNKLLQKEDWRQRPLPADMLRYATTDAQYLLYIAECLSSELKQMDNETPLSPDDKFRFLLEASRRSNSTCLQLFSKDVEGYPGESAASSIVSRHVNDRDRSSSSDSELQFQNFVRIICAWRDIMARVHDESLRFLLSEQAIISIAIKGPATGV